MTLKPETKKYLEKTFKGALIASGMAGVTFLAAEVNLFDADANTLVMMTIISALLNGIREFFKQQQEKLSKT